MRSRGRVRAKHETASGAVRKVFVRGDRREGAAELLEPVQTEAKKITLPKLDWMKPKYVAGEWM